MRHAATPSESALWSALAERKLGVVFRRQVVLLCGRVIADFFAAEVGLVVEVDGPYHARRRAADEHRDRKLRRAGYRVLRLDAELVLRELPVAVERVREALHEAGEERR